MEIEQAQILKFALFNLLYEQRFQKRTYQNRFHESKFSVKSDENALKQRDNDVIIQK